MNFKRLLNAVVIATLLTGLLMLGGEPTVAAGRDTPGQKAIKASVFIVMLDNDGEMIGSGSGSILTTDGMILSNYHVVGDLQTKKLNNSKGLIANGVLDYPNDPSVVN